MLVVEKNGFQSLLIETSKTNTTERNQKDKGTKNSQSQQVETSEVNRSNSQIRKTNPQGHQT
jgi:hypothetical protein